MHALQVRNVAKHYLTRSDPLVVLRDVSFSMDAGESLAIVGPSGTGKSTLLHILGTLDRPTSGTVTVHGVQPFDLAEPELAAFRQRSVGFVFQDHCLLPQLSVLENILIPALASGRPTPAHVDRGRRLMDRVGLSPRKDHRPAELSGGEKQRVAIARAMLMQPSLLLADEPTGNLDTVTADRISDLLLQMQVDDANSAAPMLIVVTHSLRLAERMGRQWTLDGGVAMESPR